MLTKLLEIVDRNLGNLVRQSPFFCYPSGQKLAMAGAARNHAKLARIFRSRCVGQVHRHTGILSIFVAKTNAPSHGSSHNPLLGL